MFVFRFLFPDLPEEGGSLADPPKEKGGSDPAGKQLESPKPGYVSGLTYENSIHST